MVIGYKHTEETKVKMKEWHTGKKLSENTKKKISTASKMHKHTKETKEKIAKQHIGMKLTDETKLKISIANKGNKAHKGKKHSEETKRKMSDAKTGTKMTEETKHKISEANKGRIKSEKERINISIALTGRKATMEHKRNMSISRRGEKSNLWKGGISFEPYCKKFNQELRERIRAFFEYQCICYGKHQNECKIKLHCHHVEYDKKACCDGKLVHFAALCHRHHSMTNSNRERWESMIHRIIDEIYDGKSYYTREEYEKICANQEEQV